MDIDEDLRKEYIKIGITDEVDMQEIHHTLEVFSEIAYNSYVKLHKEGKLEEVMKEIKNKG